MTNLPHKSRGLYERLFKRFFDVLLATCAAILLSPVLILVSLLVRMKLGSPVFFHQERPGRNGEIFHLLKFRTMLDPQTRDGRKLTDNERLAAIESGKELDILTDEERLTKFGRLLRATSLDELPELFNIILGDMSFVGPRPLAKIYLPYYTETEMRRHEVRPGLTGLAQVQGRNSAPWAQRFRDDVYYVDHVTFLNDLKIILKTFVVVFKRENVGQGEARPEAFNVERQRELDARRAAEEDVASGGAAE